MYLTTAIIKMARSLNIFPGFAAVWWYLSLADAATTIRPWGDNAIRIQICEGACSDTLPQALGTSPPGESSGAVVTATQVISGNLKATVGHGGLLTFTRIEDGITLLRQTGQTTPSAITGGSATFDFSESATTVYGMGQNRPTRSSSTIEQEVCHTTRNISYTHSHTTTCACASAFTNTYCNAYK